MPNVSSSGLSRLQAIVEKQVGAADLESIVTKFVAKAKEGDVPSAKFVVDYLLGAKHTPTSVVVNQFFDGDGAPQAVVTQTPEQRICSYLSAAGEATAETISADTKLSVSQVVQVLDNRPQRFAVNGRKYSLVRA